MKKKILIFVHTEYHLLLTINQILCIYNNPEKFEIDLIIRVKDGDRISQDLDFTNLPANVSYFRDEVSIEKNLSFEARSSIQKLLALQPDIFMFFQEMDPLMTILSGYYAKSGAEVCLYQDGLKPYVHLKFHSLGLLKHFHQQNVWMKRNGFPVESWLSPIWAKKFAHLKSISKVYLTFPESYINWNHKEIVKIEMDDLDTLKDVLKKVFRWDDTLLPVRNKVIFYMNQPMHDDGEAEIEMLAKLTHLLPDYSFYIKLHPLTIKLDKVKKYANLQNVHVINSKIPAELFILHLTDSIILSVNSTSMFMNNMSCRYYYLFKLFDKQIKRLSRYKLNGSPSKHINVAEVLADIK